MKYLLLLFLSVGILFGGSYHFKEKRYIYSVDKTLEMVGRISFDEKGMRIEYSSPEVRHIHYDGFYMDLLDGEGKTLQHIDLNKQPMMKVYMEFIHQLYRSDYEALRENFKILKTETTILLTPIAPIDKVITSVVIHKTPKSLSQIKTKMSNGDEITLDITP